MNIEIGKQVSNSMLFNTGDSDRTKCRGLSNETIFGLFLT